MPVTIVRNEQHYSAKTEWLSTNWHFSFDHYFDPRNVSFGPLRVFNDDTVRPGGGWGMHPHRDMEIITYVVRGQLEHQDSAGGKAVVEAGGVQCMTAGRGIFHSEYNPSQTEDLRLLQIWILPDRRGLQPHHETRLFGKDSMHGLLLPVVSGKGGKGTLKIHQDAAMYSSRLSPAQAIEHHLEPGRKGYLFVVRGVVGLGGQTLEERDVARVEGKEELKVTARQDAELILLDLPSS